MRSHLQQQMPKKIWEDDKGGGGDAPKAMFHGGGNPWAAREDAWTTNTSGGYWQKLITLGAFDWEILLSIFEALTTVCIRLVVVSRIQMYSTFRK